MYIITWYNVTLGLMQSAIIGQSEDKKNPKPLKCTIIDIGHYLTILQYLVLH